MNKIFLSFIAMLAISGCDQVQAPIIENNYQSALASGNIKEQLQSIDELALLNLPEHQELIERKKALLPHLLKLMENPKNVAGINDESLNALIEFSPNADVLSFAKQYLKKKTELTSALNEAIKAIQAEKSGLAEKLNSTPSHVTTYETNIKLAYLQPYFLLSEEVRALIKQHANKKLNGYQIEALINSLAKLSLLNKKAIKNTRALNDINSTERVSIEGFQAYNQDISQVLLWLYKKHVLETYQSFSTQNEHFISLIQNQYGVQSLDDVWLKEVEPLAKKAVMDSKQTHLSLLNKIVGELEQSTEQHTRLSDLKENHAKLEQQLLSLLWPTDGLINFEKSSMKNKILLKKAIIRLQQL